MSPALISSGKSWSALSDGEARLSINETNDLFKPSYRIEGRQQALLAADGLSNIAEAVGADNPV